MTDITTVQFTKKGLDILRRAKLNYEAKIGKRISNEKFILEKVQKD
jgi:hypothetical protein